MIQNGVSPQTAITSVAFFTHFLFIQQLSYRKTEIFKYIIWATEGEENYLTWQ